MRLHQAFAAAVGIDHRAAEELEAAVDLERLPPVVRHEAHAELVQPVHRVGALVDQHVGELGIALVLRDAAEVVEILLGGVFAEVGVGDLLLGQVGHDLADVVRAVMHHAEGAAGEGGVAAALVLRRALQHQHAGAVLARGERRAHAGAAAADHDHVMRHMRLPVFISEHRLQS